MRDVRDIEQDETVSRPPPTAAHLQRLAVVPRCQDTTAAGNPCNAPALKGKPYCTNHLGAHDPTYVRKTQHKRTTRELAIQQRAAELRVSHEEAALAERRDARGRKARKKIIDALAEQLELNPRIVVDVLVGGLNATTTRRRRRLNADGTQAAIARIWEDEESGKTKMELEPVFEDIAEPDWKVRREFVQEVNDRLYGRPAQLKQVEGEIKHNVQHNVAALLAAAKRLEDDPQGYYESLPSTEEVDVGPGEVVASSVPA